MQNKITTTQPIYNGYNIRHILSNLPANMMKKHKRDYIKNCIEVYLNEKAGMNSGYCEAIRNSNFNMILFYNKLNQ